MDARKMLIENSEELARFIQTEQYKLSRGLMKARYGLSKTEEEMASKIGVSYEDYIGLECGNEEVSEEEYEEFIKKAKSK